MEKLAILKGISNFFASGGNDFLIDRQKVNEAMEDYQPIDLIYRKIDMDNSLTPREKAIAKKNYRAYVMGHNFMENQRPPEEEKEGKKDSSMFSDYLNWFVGQSHDKRNEFSGIGKGDRLKLLSSLARLIGGG